MTRYYAWARTLYTQGVGTVQLLELPRGHTFKRLTVWAPQVPALGGRVIVANTMFTGSATADTATANGLFTSGVAQGGQANPVVLLNQPVLAAADVWADFCAEYGQLNQLALQGSAAASSPWYFSGEIWMPPR